MTTRTLRETRRHLELISSSNYYAEFEQPPSDDEGVKDMKTTTALVLLALGALALSGCTLIGKGVAGSGVRKTEKRNLKSFKAIDTTGAYEMDVTCQKPASFEIEADDNILPLIKTDVRDGVLFVTSDKSYHTSKPVSLRISLPDLVGVATDGTGDVKIVDANSDNLKIESTGAASINAAGKAKTVYISSTGAGEIDSRNLKAEKARVNVTGAASVDVYASEQLDVTVSGAGSVNYSGNPKVVNKNVSGIGSVSKKE